MPRGPRAGRVTARAASRLVVGDREHAHLLRREPDRERAGEVLDEDRDEPLERAVTARWITTGRCSALSSPT